MNVRLAALALLAAPAVFAQQAEIEYQSTELADGIYMIEGVGGFAGGNVGLLAGDDQVVMIDDMMGSTAPGVIDAAEKLAGRGIDFVINTHVHGDHVGGNAILAKDGTIVVAHDNIRERLVADPAPAGGPAGLPVITFSDAMTFHVNGHEAHLFHVAHAHTDGDGVIHFRDVNVIHTGDVHFNHMFPFIDIDSGGSVDGYIAAQEKILSIADGNTKIMPGHGPVATRADLERDHEMLVDARAKVKALIDKGMGEEEVVEANPLAGYHDGWNWGFITTERMTRQLYRGLESPPAH